MIELGLVVFGMFIGGCLVIASYDIPVIYKRQNCNLCQKVKKERDHHQREIERNNRFFAAKIQSLMERPKNDYEISKAVNVLKELLKS